MARNSRSLVAALVLFGAAGCSSLGVIHGGGKSQLISITAIPRDVEVVGKFHFTVVGRGWFGYWQKPDIGGEIAKQLEKMGAEAAQNVKINVHQPPYHWPVFGRYFITCLTLGFVTYLGYEVDGEAVNFK